MSEAGDRIRAARLAGSLTQAQLARRAGTSQSAVNRYEQSKVTPTSATTERLIAACKSRPRPGQLLERNRDQVMELARVHGFQRVRVFGSVARGEDDEASDVDLLVDDPTTSITLLDLIGLQQDLEDLLEVSVDVGTPEMLRPRIRDRVAAEARSL
jgi:predicted nucleotidyltransferase/DNA-binding XRE family transcriptional regulator